MDEFALAELREALSTLPDALPRLRERAGQLAARGGGEDLRGAVSAVQRAVRRAEDGDASTLVALETVRDLLAAAAAVKAGEQVGTATQERSARVRERVHDLLARQDCARSSELARALDIDLPQISRALRQLQADGLVERAENQGLDGRARYYRLSTGARHRFAPYAAIAPLIDGAMIDAGLFRSDMLPLGPADRIDAARLRTYRSRLVNRITFREYSPAPAEFFLVARSADTHRRAALLGLADRVVYTSLVHALSPAVAEATVDSVLWPRGDAAPQRWREFEESPSADAEARYVVVADVAGFYDSVDHLVLADALRAVGGDADTVTVLTGFLARVMGGPVGLPQGLAASDTLASAALSRVDRALRDQNVCFYRHNDDFRFPVGDRAEARRAIACLEEALRQQRLQLNSEKTRPIPVEAYQENLEQRARAEATVAEVIGGLSADIRRLAGFETEHGLVGTSEGFDASQDPALDRLYRLDGIEHVPQLSRLLGYDPGRWFGQVGPYGEPEEPDLDAFDELLRSIQVSEDRLQWAEQQATDAIRELSAPSPSPRWQQTVCLFRLSTALSVLSLGRRPAGNARLWENFLWERPEHTKVVARYFAFLAHAGDHELPMRLTRHALERPLSDWQCAWLLSAAAWSRPGTARDLQAVLARSLDSAGWLTRIAAASLLERDGLLSESQLAALLTDVPTALRADALVLAGRSAVTAPLAGHTDELDRVLVGAVEQG